MSIATKVIGLVSSVFGMTRGTDYTTITANGSLNNDGLRVQVGGTVIMTAGRTNGQSTVHMNTISGDNFSTTTGGITIRVNGLEGVQLTSPTQGVGIVRLSRTNSTTPAVLCTPCLTPAQITSNQDNYAPGVATHYRLSTDASRDITGLSASQLDGQICNIINVGSFNIVLKHDVTSTAANRFLCVGSVDITLTPNGIAHLIYDNTSQRWRVGRLT